MLRTRRGGRQRRPGFAARLYRESVGLRTAEATAAAAQPLIRTRKAAWQISSSLAQQVQQARQTLNETRNQRHIEAWVTPGIGAQRLKSLQLSPDAMVQLALQVAVTEATGRPLSIVEPVQTRHFAGGRMDFIVSVTAESMAVVAGLQDANRNSYRLAAQIRRAVKAHQNLVLRAKSGRGLIAHLLALNAVRAANPAQPAWSINSWRHDILAHLDKGLKTLTRQDVLASNGSGFTGIAAFCPIGPRPHMLSIGYIIEDGQITFDLRADGRLSPMAGPCAGH